MGLENSSYSAGGLSRSMVLRRREEEGYNELPTGKPKRFISIVIGVIKEPMVYLLLGCGFVYRSEEHTSELQ